MIFDFPFIQFENTETQFRPFQTEITSRKRPRRNINSFGHFNLSEKSFIEQKQRQK